MSLIYLFIYLFKIDNRRIARGPRILSEIHKNTEIYTIHGNILGSLASLSPIKSQLSCNSAIPV